MAPETPSVYPLYNTTFSLHRVSPLYTGTSTLSNSTLSTHARHLQDILRGESLRGVRVGLRSSEDNLARVGALQNVEWRILAAESDFNPDETMGEDGADEIGEQAGIVLDIIYEKAEYRAILLKGAKEERHYEADENFTKLPILLTRMPGSLREIVLDFLTTTFDARISTFRLSSIFVSQTLEKYLADLLQPSPSGEALSSLLANKMLRQTIKDLLVTVAFVDGTALKSMDILISKDDLYRMITRGKKLQQVHQSQGQEQQHMFMALKHYIKGHMALDISHENVKVSKIACAAFVLGSEGKLKLFPPLLGSGETLEDSAQARATNGLVERLVTAASSKESIPAG